MLLPVDGPPFVGGSIFEVGSYSMILEALNRKHVGRNLNGRQIDERFVFRMH
jgi:hypothetical protein